MKLNVQQIILFTQATKKLRAFVNQAVESVPVQNRNGQAWQKLMEVDQAAGVVKFMADQLCNSEITVKG